MFRQFVAMLLVVISISLPGAAAGRAADKAPNHGVAALKEQIVQIPAGAVVEVKFQRKGEKNLVGRLGPIADTSFEVQSAKEGNITSEKVAFADVKSVKPKGKGMHPAAKAGIIAGAVAGGILLTAGILAASGALGQ